ncbi:MAG: ligand-gated channel protein [Gammaproteobacteria bacterium HGW-Gammaproteobacteria-11]|nr:MAG: ligand-gated channel protein [Gammaproteobacteria bacterium HGW-Gammaproteobacteria-11]
MRYLNQPSLLALSIFTALVGTVQAQPVTEQITLPDQTVTATRQADPTAPSLLDTRESFARIPGGATVVDAETYKTGRSSTLQDALGLATGVFVQPRFGAEEARISIRGSGLQRTFHGRGLLLMQDGAPVNLADGSFDFQSIEPLAADHVQVLRGANAWRYGATNLGGAVNFITPTGKTARPADLRLEGGSFGYRRLHAALAQDLGNWDGFVSLSHSEQDGYRQHAQQDNQRLFANLGGHLTDRIATRFYLTHVDTDSALPGNLTKAQLRDDPRQANPGSVTNDNRRDFILNRLGNISVLQINAAHSLELSSFYSEKSLFHPIFQVLDVDSEDMGLRLTHRWANDAGWRWSMGVEALEGRNTDQRFVNQSGQKGQQVNHLRQSASNLNAFAELEVPVAERWALFAGLAALRQERDVNDRLRCNAFVTAVCVPQDESFSKTYRGELGRLGLRHDLTDDIQLFGNISQSMEPPTFSELTGGQVISANDAQRATTLEIGMRLSRGNMELDLAVYRSQIRDELLALNDASGQPQGTINADKTLHQGIELGGAYTLGQVVLRGQYLLNDFRFEDDPVYGNNRLAGVPRHFLKGEALWQDAGWYAGPTVEWVPSQYAVDHAASLFAEGYAIWGLKAGFRPTQGLGFFVEGRNLSDRSYIATTGVIADALGADSAQFLPGDGRGLFAGLEWRL